MITKEKEMELSKPYQADSALQEPKSALRKTDTTCRLNLSRLYPRRRCGRGAASCPSNRRGHWKSPVIYR